MSYTFWLEPNREFINELSHPNNIVVNFYMAIYLAFIMEHTKVITLMFPSKYLLVIIKRYPFISSFIMKKHPMMD